MTFGNSCSGNSPCNVPGLPLAYMPAGSLGYQASFMIPQDMSSEMCPEQQMQQMQQLQFHQMPGHMGQMQGGQLSG